MEQKENREQSEQSEQADGLDVAGAFGIGGPRTWAGRQWCIRYLDVNDLIVLQQRIGGVARLNTGSIEHMRLFFWLALRKSEPGLTEDDLDNERYNLTEKQVGRILNLRLLNDPDTNRLTRDILIGSGLVEPDQGNASGNAPAGEGAAAANA